VKKSHEESNLRQPDRNWTYHIDIRTTRPARLHIHWIR